MASGCFWGREYHLRNLPGVEYTRVGFAGGHTPNPTYQEVCEQSTGHAETVEVVYDTRIISHEAVLREFFLLHDFSQNRTQSDGQYRSAIFVLEGEKEGLNQWKVAREMMDFLGENGQKVATELTKISAFFAAGSRHQQYCSARGITPKRRDFKKISEILTLFSPQINRGID
ncbi:peptide-methionine (S)-S-oxide reductase MsrA [Lewinella sp. W8]|uniref:peptide-methionine (S)-S-oxide reductase MsrA n=1 Tax=Lewinella sp. W8 TaxID=2528208 RepID=UPI001067908F|nr:peptide-methionine (S)-S-oxide reductase MsrA [Lewinella sp. W8]MTB51967.1 peptide-methionine (S)-S-oxide reductase MsrA [Lewinella sp. W8]